MILPDLAFQCTPEHDEDGRRPFSDAGGRGAAAVPVSAELQAFGERCSAGCNAYLEAELRSLGECEPDAGPGETVGAPPDTNRGAQSAERVDDERREGVACVDWVAFSFPDGGRAEERVRMLQDSWGGAAAWQDQGRGFNGYRRCARNGNLSIAWDGNPGMGIHVQVSGQGCWQLEEFTWFRSWPWLLRKLCLLYGVHLSRFDVAVDDLGGRVSLDEVERVLRERECCSRSRSWRSVEGYRSLATGELEGGRTLYIGKRPSGTMMRIYDRAAERGEGGHWVRVEAEFRNDRAGAMAAEIARGGLERVLGVVGAHFSPRVPSTENEQRTRWDVAPWWSEFLGGVTRLGLGIPVKRRTVDQVRAWVLHQVAPSLAVLDALEQAIWGPPLGRREWYEAAVKAGFHRLKRKHAVMLSEALDAFGVSLA